MVFLLTRICLIPLVVIWYFTCHYDRPESRATIDAMTRLLQFRPVFGVVCLALGLSLTQGCAHSQPLQRSDTGSPSEQKLPFHSDTDQALASEGAHPAVSPDPRISTALPFRTGSQPRILPSGTLLTVQLEDALSAAKARVGDTFLASVAPSLAIDGDPLIERGATATGHIESVRADARSGYFQLTLTALTIDGRQLALQTSSLFTRGTAQRSDGIRVQKGRRLTFRLTSPVRLDEPKSVADRQSLSPTIE
jgi:hypothetical protein